jgi:CubicO group peptidase (beta-lactamase class C family)
VVAIAAHLLADRGLLDYDAPVATYWPEFAQGGKQSISVRQLLSHQTSLVFIDDAQAGDVLKFHDFSTKIARQAPNWPPGTAPTYHSITYGFLVGTLIERIDGRPVKQFVQEELARPLGADFILGVADSDLPRVAPTIFNTKNELMSGGLINEITMKCFAALPADPGFFNSTDHWKAVIPSSSGLSHSEAIARIFAPLANEGRFEGKSYFKPSTVKAMSETQWHANDSLFGNEFSVTMGLLNSIDFNYFGRPENFGSAGAGGFTGFADPVKHIAFAYTPVRMTSGAGLGDEPRRLVDALYSCV